MTKFQIVSDLHIEYNNYIDPLKLITPSAEILILAGDIGSLYKINQLKNFLSNICKHFKAVIYVPGNHEYYIINDSKPETMFSLNNKLSKIEKEIDNLYILNRASLKIDNVCIIGATLWSSCKVNIPKYIVRINGMNNRLYNNLHEQDLSYIESMIKYCKKNNLTPLVVSHHCPTYSVIKTQKKKNDRFISLYATNLEYLLNKSSVHTWVCGHIHSNFDMNTEGGTRIVGNQFGKPKDNIRDYYKDFVISV